MKNLGKVSCIVFSIFILLASFFISYKKTELRLEKIYKIDNPGVMEILLEMYR